MKDIKQTLPPLSLSKTITQDMFEPKVRHIARHLRIDKLGDVYVLCVVDSYGNIRKMFKSSVNIPRLLNTTSNPLANDLAEYFNNSERGKKDWLACMCEFHLDHTWFWLELEERNLIVACITILYLIYRDTNEFSEDKLDK